MRPRALTILFAVVLALTAFIWLFERDLPSSDERREQAKRVLPLAADEVNGVELRLPDRPTVRLEREAEEAEGEDGEPGWGAWRIVEPLTARADDRAVDGLVNDLVELQKERTLEDADPAQLGLESPRAEVLLTAAGEEARLLIGSEIPASTNMIVSSGAGSDPHVVAAGLWDDVAKEPGEWRSRDLFVGDLDDVETVRIASASGDVAFAQRGDEFWLDSPLVDRADEDAIDTLIDDLTGLRVEEFVDELLLEPAALGLEPPVAVVEAGLAGDAEPFRLEIGDRLEGDEPRRYARAGEQIVTIDDSLDEALTQPLEEWQSKAWATLQTWQVDRVTITEGGEELVLERDGADWKRGDERISNGPVSDLLYAVTDAAAERVVSPQEAAGLGASAETPELRLRLEGEDVSDELTLVGAVEGGVLAATEGREFSVLLPAATADEVLSKIEAVRVAEPQDSEDESEADLPVS